MRAYEFLTERVKRVKGRWALVSKSNPKKVLQYYHGAGYPSKDWISGVERRVHSFESIMEGGNLTLPGGDAAEQIDLKVTNRSIIVPILKQLLDGINQGFQAQYNKPLWSPELLKSGEFLSGSSLHFFNVKGISDEDFVAKKPKVGDIDTQVNKENEQELDQFLRANQGKVLGSGTLLGFQRGNEQFSSLWQLTDVPIKVQIDLEFVKFDQDKPTAWAQFSHSSSWEDIQAGVKGVFHKFLIQSLATLGRKEFLLRKMVGRGKARTEQDVPTEDNMLSFAVSSKEGGGLRAKYAPVLDDQGLPLIKDNMQVMVALPAENYEQDIDKIFLALFGDRIGPKQAKALSQKFWSFVGLLDVMNQLLSPEDKQRVVDSFIGKLFEKGAQGLYKNDPQRDAAEKNAALDKMFSILGVSAPADLDQKRSEYTSGYKMTGESITEAEDQNVVVSKRKGIVHLEKMKDVDFLNLLDELRDEATGEFKLDNVPMNVKVDGMGGRFGKDATGRPFFESSSSGPIFEPGSFSAFQAKRGVTDPVMLSRGQNYDKLFDRVMNLIANIDNAYGEDFLVDKKVHAELLYAPMAEEVDGKLKYVNIAYNKLPKGVALALVPLFVEESSTGKDAADSNQIVRKLRSLGRLDDSMFIDNSLAKGGSINVTGVVKPLESIEGLRSMVTSTKRADKALAKDLIAPIKQALADAIINNPDILGKDILGQDYEGIVLNTQAGPVKITSPQFKDIMSKKMAAQKQPTTGSKRHKSAVVTAGSFVGHKGHQQLVDLTLQKAAEVGGDPYVYISSKVGPDDPIPPEMKLETWKKLYPEHADMFQLIVSPDGVTSPSPVKKIEKELVLPANSPYNKVILLVGADRYEGFKKWMDTLSKRMKDPAALAKFGGTQNEVDFETVRTSRAAEEGGTGLSFTQLRNVLKDPNMSEQEQLATWMQGFDGAKLGEAWVKQLMDTARKNMGIMKKPANESVYRSIFKQV